MDPERKKLLDEIWPSYNDLLELTDQELLSVEQRAVQLAEQTRIIRRDRR